ncbi:hypothetical protein QYF61_013625, partial [Mycteria americana]
MRTLVPGRLGAWGRELRPRPSTPVLVRGVQAVPVPSCLRLPPQRLGAAGSAVCSPPPPPECFQRLSKVQNRYALKIGSGASNNFRLSNVNCILGSSRGSVTSRSREVIHFLDIDEATAVPGFETLSSAKMLRNWRVQWRATERRVKGDLIAAYNYLKGGYKDGGARLFLVLADYSGKMYSSTREQIKERPGTFVEGPCATGLSDVVTSRTGSHCIEHQTHIWGKYLSWFSPSRQLSTTQPLAHSPSVGWGRESEEQKCTVRRAHRYGRRVRSPLWEAFAARPADAVQSWACSRLLGLAAGRWPPASSARPSACSVLLSPNESSLIVHGVKEASDGKKGCDPVIKDRITVRYVRQGKKCRAAAVRERSEKNVRNNSADTKVREEGGGGGAPGTGAEIPLQPMVKTMGRKVVPVQPMEVIGGADIHLQPVEDPTLKQADMPWRKLQPVENPCQRRLLAGTVAPGEEPTLEKVFWQDLWPCGGPTLEQSVPEGLHPVERTRAGTVLEELQPTGRTCAGVAHAGLYPVDMSMLEPGKSVRRKERQRQGCLTHFTANAAFPPLTLPLQIASRSDLHPTFQ